MEDYSSTCQADHLPPASLLSPARTALPTRLRVFIILNFIELPTSSSGHHCMQVQIHLLTGHVQLVPTMKTATVPESPDYCNSCLRYFAT